VTPVSEPIIIQPGESAGRILLRAAAAREHDTAEMPVAELCSQDRPSAEGGDYE
jgi:hypothetical protein